MKNWKIHPTNPLNKSVLQGTHIRLPLALVEDAHVGRARRQRRHVLQLGLEDVARAHGATQGFLHLAPVKAMWEHGNHHW